MSGGTSNFLSYRMKPLQTLFALTSAVRRRRLMLPVLSVPAPSYSTGFCCFFTVIQGSYNTIFSPVCSYLGFQVFVLEGQVFEPSSLPSCKHLTSQNFKYLRTGFQLSVRPQYTWKKKRTFLRQKKYIRLKLEPTERIDFLKMMSEME